jgi:hypothetical protein
LSSSTESFEAIKGLTVFDLTVGLFVADGPDSFQLTELTENVANVPGQLFGCAFSYSNTTGRTFPYRWELIRPQSYAEAEDSAGAVAAPRIQSDGRIIKYTEGLTPGEMIQYSIVRLDSSDPTGTWRMELYVSDRLYETLTFCVFSVPQGVA